jgi:type VI secretion system protein ImpB
VDKDNFSEVMKKQNLALSFSVSDRLSGKEDSEMPVNLRVESLADFTPDRIAEQVPELNKLLELRKALQALKGPLGNLPAFQKKLKGIMESEAEVEKLMKELGAGGEAAKGEEK